MKRLNVVRSTKYEASQLKLILDFAPIARVLPSLLSDTEDPKPPELNSPLISDPLCSHTVPVHSYTRTCPLPDPPPALLGDPIASTDASLLRDTDVPDASPASSPLMLCPLWTHADPFHSNTRTLPALLPFASLFAEPTAKILPSLLRAMDSPKKSPTFSPSISAPCCTQSLPSYSNTRTWPLLVPFPSLSLADIATTLPSALIDTEWPLLSSAASPSISDPLCCQLLPTHSKTLAWPISNTPPPSWLFPPTTMMLPS